VGSSLYWFTPSLRVRSGRGSSPREGKVSTWKRIKENGYTYYVCPDIPNIARGHWGPWQEIVSWEQLPPKWRQEHEWAAPKEEEEYSSQRFVKIQGCWIPVETFTKGFCEGKFMLACESFSGGTICQIDFEVDRVRLAPAYFRAS
jgi:hypothetical protein